MPELGPIMRALELQRILEDKVSEWRERSVRVAGASVAESYQQPHNFKRHTNRRKNSAEINRIIAKYSKPYKRPDERHCTATATAKTRPAPAPPPARPPRPKKQLATLKILSKSEDNLANVVGAMELHPDPTSDPKPRYLSKYNAKSCEDITAFVDIQRSVKSRNFEENSILNAKPVPTRRSRQKLHSISEDVSAINDSGLEVTYRTNFVTSTPVSQRKTISSDTVLVDSFEKCNFNSGLRRGSSEPDVLDVSSSRESVDTMRSTESKKRWKLLKPPFRKGALDCLFLWRGKKPKPKESSSRIIPRSHWQPYKSRSETLIKKK